MQDSAGGGAARTTHASQDGGEEGHAASGGGGGAGVIVRQRHDVGPALLGLSTGQAVALGVAVLLALLVGGPRLLRRLRRRQRSGMRSE